VPDHTILVTGGAGYIGSHVVLALREFGSRVVVLDDLSVGRREAIPEDVVFVEGDAGDSVLVAETIRHHDISGVVHFAGSTIVPESIADPLKYYRNNSCASRALIQACIEGGVRNFVFSSSAAVYGIPDRVPVAESAPARPINPYGASKLFTEWTLKDAAAAHDFRYAALRYFNVAGADGKGRAGQSTANATHLIKVACGAALSGRPVEIFGDDYDTADGTCVRDYVHVSDLAVAHVDALRALCEGTESMVLNCGYGRGYSVRDVLAAVEREAGVSLDTRIAARRPGDPPALVADTVAITQRLGWRPQYDDLAVIVRTALDWERGLAGGT